VFVGYGTIILVAGFALGSALGIARIRVPDARALATAHVETLLQAAITLGLGFAVGAVGFDSAAANLGAWLVVGGAALQATGATVNWLTATVDQFAERSVGLYLNSTGTVLIWPGVVVTAFGILSRL